MIRVGSCLSFVLVLSLHALHGQTIKDSLEFDGAAERSFVSAMRLFIAEDYDSSSRVFMRHLRVFPRSHRTTGAYVMGGKALHEARRYRESIRLLKDLIDLYPNSTYVDDAHYTLALDYYSLQRYEDALDEIIIVREMAEDTTLWRRTEELVDRLASLHLPLERMEEGIRRSPDAVLRVLLSLRMAERIERQGDIRRAVSVLDGVAGLSRSVKYVDQVYALLERLEAGRTLKIGVALPLMMTSTRPGAREVGLEFLEGMRIAADRFNETSISKVNLEVRDTEGEEAVAARVVTELSSDADVVAILGPTSSSEAFAAAGIAQANGVPLITPTATSNGIADIGSHIFQANPDYDVRGRGMAAFAQRTLKADTFAVLAPADAVGKLMADGFIRQVQENGDDLVSVQWYYAGSTDLRSQIEEIRRVALQRKVVPYVNFAVPMPHRLILEMVISGADQRMIDSLVETGSSMSVDSLLGPGGLVFADSLGIPVSYREVDIDSLGITVDNVDAIFVPIASSEEIAVVSSQLRFFNFAGTMLGTGDWDDPTELDRNRRYTLGVIYSVDSYVDTRDSAYRAFTAEYARRVGRQPSVNALIGYDAAQLLLSVIAKGATVRREISEGLSQVRGFRGLRSNISFTPGRVNGFLWVVRYQQDGVVRIGQVDLTEEPAGEELEPEPGSVPQND